VGSAASSLEEKVAGWADRLEGVAARGGVSDRLTSVADAGLDGLADDGGAKQKAATEGVKASLHGKNPVWAAVKGAWQAGTPVVKAAIVAGAVSAVLLLLVSPVLLLAFLLSLLVIAAVQRARAGKR
jgi:hypothetical protein